MTAISTQRQLRYTNKQSGSKDRAGQFQDYVIVHELIHLKVPNHGKLFTSLLAAYLPGYKYGARPEIKSRSL